MTQTAGCLPTTAHLSHAGCVLLRENAAVPLHQLAARHEGQVAGLAHSNGEVLVAPGALEAQPALVLSLLQPIELSHLALTLTRSLLLHIALAAPGVTPVMIGTAKSEAHPDDQV